MCTPPCWHGSAASLLCLLAGQQAHLCLTLAAAVQVPQLPICTSNELPGLQAALELCLGGTCSAQDALAALRDIEERAQQQKEAQAAAAAAAAQAEAAARAARARQGEREARLSGFLRSTLFMASGAFMLR